MCVGFLDFRISFPSLFSSHCLSILCCFCCTAPAIGHGGRQFHNNGMVQEIKRLSLKFDDRNLADGAYRSGRECSSNNLPPPPPPQQFSFNDRPCVNNHINHHHHQDVLYDNFLTKILLTKKNSSTPSIQRRFRR